MCEAGGRGAVVVVGWMGRVGGERRDVRRGGHGRCLNEANEGSDGQDKRSKGCRLSNC